MEDDHMSDIEGGESTVEIVEVGEIALTPEENRDLCEKLMEEYGNSTIEQHQRVLASASAMRKLLQQRGKPPTPLSYLDATVFELQIDRKSTPSHTSFLSMLLPLVPSQSLPSSKANQVVTLLVSLFETPQSHVTILNVIKSFAFLIPLCDLDDLSCAKSVFEMILGFSIHKHCGVRNRAQRYIGKIYNSVQSTVLVSEEASELFYSMLFYKYLPYAIAIAWSRILITEDSEEAQEYLLRECVSMLTVLKLIVSYLSNDVVQKVMDQVHTILGLKYSLLTRHSFAFLEAILESSTVDEIVVPKTEIIIFALGNYVSPQENNPVDTVLSACGLLKRCIDKIYADNRSLWLINLPLVFEPLARVVGAGLIVSGEAAGTLKKLVNQHIDFELKTSASIATLPSGEVTSTPESKALESVCAAIEMHLTNSDGELNKDILSVVSQMFLKLGDLSYSYLKGVVHKLTELRRVGDTTRTNYQYLEDALAVLEQNSADPAKRSALGPTGGYVAR